MSALDAHNTYPGGWILAQSFPKLVELRLKTVHEFAVVGDDDVFVVLGGGGAGPIVAAGEEKVVVGDSELVVHVCGGAVEATADAGVAEVIEIGAEVFGFVVIRDDANANLAGVGFFEFFDDAIVSDGENADVEGLAGFANESSDAVKAVFAGAEVGAGFDLVFAGVEELNDSLQPVERGDLTELVNGVIGQTESELSGFGLPDFVASNFGEMDFEILLFRSTEGKVLK